MSGKLSWSHSSVCFCWTGQRGVCWERNSHASEGQAERDNSVKELKIRQSPWSNVVEILSSFWHHHWTFLSFDLH